ncbi:PBSX family phage terminase large subunit [Secundilactobacillus pentosiphilus]|nr:PBSX family phage terminase large subunit [Secundilactobacillus pentosiphilus]
MAVKEKSKLIIKTSELVNPHFKLMWVTKCPYVIAKGGRGSFKSSTISLKLVTMMKRQIQLAHKANIVCVRENTVNLRDSVYGQICWAIDMLNMTKEFTYSVSPMRINHKRTGSSFYFYGGDKPEKLKSNTIQNVIALWFEEAANFKSAEVFDQTVPTFIRQKSPWIDEVKVFYSYNPPRNPYEWINKWIEQCSSDPAYFIDTSTYLDDELGITTDQQLKLIESYKRNDYNYYEWLYLGKVIGLGTNIYNMDLFHPLVSFPDDDSIKELYFSQDSGQQVSATTEICIGLTAKGRVILLDTYYYSPAHQAVKKAPSDLAVELHDFETSREAQWGKQAWKKSADEATSDYAIDHEYFKRYNEHWHHVHKVDKTVMIDNVQNLLATGRFYYLDNEANQIFITEHQKYQWDEKTVETDKPKVVKVDDHTCDAFQYFVLDNLVDLGLKW